MSDLLVWVKEYCFLSVIIFVVVIWFTSWFYCSITQGICKSQVRMDGKTVIITGSDTGIGKATAVDLARRGARVIMACINLEQAHKVRDYIIKETGNANVVVKFIDLSSLASVRVFAEDVNSTESRLDVLIHNAGLLIPPTPVTEDGLNMVLAVNHFGPFLLTHLVIDLLKKTGKSRVVVVSSIVHKHSNAVVDPNNPNPLQDNPSKKYHFQIYAMSKFATVLCAKELSRRLQFTGVTVNTLHPGIVATEIIKPIVKPIPSSIVTAMPFFRSAEKGAQTSIYLAVSEDLEGVTGKYFSDCKERSAAEKADDVELAQKYWTVCENIVKLRLSDPRL